MDGLFILAIIAWVILSAVSGKKQKEQREARKKAASAGGRPTQAGPFPDAFPEASPGARPAPVRPQAPPAPAGQRMPEAAFAAEGDTTPAQAKARGEQPRRPVPPPENRMNSGMQSTLRGTPMQHTLEVSGVSGHAHEETSITGVQGEPCPPEKPGKTAAGKAAPAVASAPSGAFRWNQNQVLQGVVMAEILGKPRCLRQERR